MPIENLPKGALPDLPDKRDYQASEIMGAVQVDWSKEFRLPNPGDEDQGSSLSCVAQAWSYYHNQLHPADYSRRDIYCQIVIQGGGAYIRDGGLRIKNYGQATRDEVPDPKPETEAGMTDKTGVTAAKEESHKELDSFVLPKDIDSVAAAIQQYKGVVFGLSGNNDGWHDLENPTPPSPNTVNWGHALYAMGFHMHNGMKCIIAKSSWCDEVKEHHIKEDYFNAGMTFNPWTLIPKEQQTTMQLVNDKGTVYIVSGNQDKRKIGIADPETLGLFGDEPQVSMDTSAIPEYQTISKGFVIHNK